MNLEFGFMVIPGSAFFGWVRSVNCRLQDGKRRGVRQFFKLCCELFAGVVRLERFRRFRISSIGRGTGGFQRGWQATAKGDSLLGAQLRTLLHLG